MKFVLDGVRHWRHDLSSCLQDCVAILLAYHGHEPIDSLGAALDFYYPPGDVDRAEYYYPTRWGGTVESLMPYHRAKSIWHRPVGDDWAAVRAEVLDGHPAIVAVDNYFLPFRPAYRDVRTNHLVVVYGFDDEAGEVFVLDSKPPRFSGAIRLEELTDARWSGTPVAHDRDLFYTNKPIGGRWLSVRFEGDFPELSAASVREAILSNVERFRAPADGTAYSGLAGIRDYLRDVAGRAPGPDGEAAMEELYVVGWTAQQSAGLHADYLRTAARTLDAPVLAELGRRVDRIAHHWSDVRMVGGHQRHDPPAAVSRVASRAAALVADTDLLLTDMRAVADTELR